MCKLMSLMLPVLMLTLPASSAAQGILGCSVVPSSWGAIQQGLDKLALGACTQHDQCYRICNPPGGPYVGLGYKANCDTTFALNLAFACNTWSFILSFPNIEWVDRADFMNDCLGYAENAYYLVLSAGTYFFLEGQCTFRCNRSACSLLGRLYGSFEQGQCQWHCWPGLDRDDCDLFPWGADCPMCPIALDFQGNGLKLTGPNPAVYFDLDADGTPDHTSWTRMQTKDGFLVFDRNQNGRIDDGREMFGNATPLMLSAAVARHGYEALAEFDEADLGGNGNGLIDRGDRVFAHLQVWLDENRDAATQEGELISLSDLGIAAISLSYYHDEQEDQWGNLLRWWSPIYFEDGSQSMSVDIFFKRIAD